MADGDLAKKGSMIFKLAPLISIPTCSAIAVFLLLVFFVGVALYIFQGGSPGSACTNGSCGFDTSKLAKYEQECNGSTVPLNEVINPSAKDYAVSIGVPAEDIKVWEESAVEDLIRQEIAKQWPSLKDKHGSIQTQAQRAILSYAYHEGGMSKFKESGGNIVPIHDSTTFSPLSITDDKYSGCKNTQYAVAWDIKYAIYRGVKENFDAFISNATGEGESRWKDTIGYVFLHTDRTCYWTDPDAPCRKNVSEEGWAKYANETEYVCSNSGSSGCDVDLSKVKDLVSADMLEWLKQNIPIYQEAAAREGIPWELLAAIHYREGSWKPGTSILNGFELCNNINGSRCSACDAGATQLNDAICAARLAKQKAQQEVGKCPGIGGYTLGPTTGDEATIKWTLYGYNGIGYGCDPNDSPYVMNPYPGAMMKCAVDGCAYKVPDQQLGAYIIYKAIIGGVI